MKRTPLQTKPSGLTFLSDSPRNEVLFFFRPHFLFFNFSPAHIAHNCKPHKPAHKPKLAIECNLPTLLFFVASLLLTSNLFGQIQTPQPATFQQVNPNQSYPQWKNNVPQNNQQDIINKRNEQIIQQSQQQQYEKRQQVEELYNDLHEDERKRIINYNFPSLSRTQGTSIFRKAFSTIDSMLTGLQPLNLKKAIYSVENVYTQNQLSYSKFNNQIKYIADVCRQKMLKENISPNNREAVNMILYQVLCDTVDVQNPKSKIFYRSFPYRYDFIDFRGEKDYSKMFVSKLLKTHSGNCRSMPLLYLIIAEELNTEAYLTFAPSHSFIRFQDNKNNWQNVELTNGRLSSDAWVLGSGYIKAEALNSKIYLDTIDKKQTIAALLSDLGEEYIIKIGYDEFPLQCINRSLEFFPNNIQAIMEKSDYYTLLFKYVVDQKGKPPLEKLKQDPKAFAIYQQRNELYDTMDNSGYEDMPKEAYEQWLKSIDTEIAKMNKPK